MKFKELVKICKIHDDCCDCPERALCDGFTKALSCLNPEVLSELGINPDLRIDEDGLSLDDAAQRTNLMSMP